MKQLEQIARKDLAQRVAKLSRQSKWLLLHMASIHPTPICTTNALPCGVAEQPKMMHLNGLVARAWAQRVANGIYGITPAGIAAAKIAQGGAL